MTYTELVNDIAKKTSIDTKTVKKVMEGFRTSFLENIVKGPVNVSDIGKWEVKTSNRKEIKFQGKIHAIKNNSRVIFTSWKKLKETVNK